MTIRRDGGDIVVRLDDLSDTAEFGAGEYITIKSFSKSLEKGTENKKPLTSTLFSDDGVELNFADGYGIIVRDRSLLDVLGIERVPDPNRGRFFLGSNQEVATMQQPIKNTLPPDLTAATFHVF